MSPGATCRASRLMEEGTMLSWMKSVGDEVTVGDELVEIDSDKANMVYESDLHRTTVRIVAPEGDTLPVGDVDRPGRRCWGGGSSNRRRTGAAARGRAPSTAEQGANGRMAQRPGHRPRSRPGRRTPSLLLRQPRDRRRQRPHPLPQPLLEATGASRPRRSRDAWRRSGGWTSRPQRVRPRRPDRQGGRREGGRRRRCCSAHAGAPPAPAPPAGAGSPDARRAREARDRQGQVGGRRAHQAPADGRAPHGRVEGHGAALLPAGRGAT